MILFIADYLNVLCVSFRSERTTQLKWKEKKTQFQSRKMLYLVVFSFQNKQILQYLSSLSALSLCVRDVSWGWFWYTVIFEFSHLKMRAKKNNHNNTENVLVLRVTLKVNLMSVFSTFHLFFCFSQMYILESLFAKYSSLPYGCYFLLFCFLIVSNTFT